MASLPHDSLLRICLGSGPPHPTAPHHPSTTASGEDAWGTARPWRLSWATGLALAWQLPTGGRVPTSSISARSERCRAFAANNRRAFSALRCIGSASRSKPSLKWSVRRNLMTVGRREAPRHSQRDQQPLPAWDPRRPPASYAAIVVLWLCVA